MGNLLSKRLEKVEQLITVSSDSFSSSPIGAYDINENLVGCYSIKNSIATLVEDAPVITIPERMIPLLEHYPLKVFYGGRGSAKTRSIVAILVERTRMSFERIVCCREIQKSIETSSYQEIVDEISRRGLTDEFTITDKKITNKKTGATFSFLGLYRNQTQIKGYAGATVAWVEEAENVSLKSWEYLDNTIRAPGSEIWISFNPANEDDPTWTEYVKPYFDKMEGGRYLDKEDGVALVKINWSDNPWFKYSSLPAKRIKLMERDYDRYLHVYEGQFFDRSEAQVLAGKFTVKEFDIPESELEFYHGMDFGFSNDPSAVVRCYILDECLYITHENGGVGVPLDDHGKLIDKIPDAKSYKIRCDCARPETVNHLKRLGYNAVSAPKWPGSVEDGVEYLRSFKHIYIHSRCNETAKEAKLWSYKVDSRTDDVLPKLDDKHNHYWDAIRYALSPMIQQGKGGTVFVPSRFARRRGRM